MHKAMGWLRRLGGFGEGRARAKNRTARVPSVLDVLEARQVLSTATIAPFATPPAVVTPLATPTPVIALSATAPATSSPYLAYAYPASTAAQSSILGPITGASASDLDTDYVQSLYRDVLGRTGNANEVAPWVASLVSGSSPRSVAAGIVNSPESRMDQVDYFYSEFLHRTPDPLAGGWVQALESGASEASVAEGILDSPEYQAAHPSTAGFVQGLYQDVLNRQGSTQEVTAWQIGLNSGESRQAVVESFVDSSEAVDNAIDSFYENFLHREPEPGARAFWSPLLQSSTDSATDMAIDFLSSDEYIRNAASVASQSQ